MIIRNHKLYFIRYSYRKGIADIRGDIGDNDRYSGESFEKDITISSTPFIIIAPNAELAAAMFQLHHKYSCDIEYKILNIEEHAINCLLEAHPY